MRDCFALSIWEEFNKNCENGSRAGLVWMASGKCEWFCKGQVQSARFVVGRKLPTSYDVLLSVRIKVRALYEGEFV